MNETVESALQQIPQPNRVAALSFWQDLQQYLPDAFGSSKSHQSWPGGYKDHVQECVNIARILYDRMNMERTLPFELSSAYLVLFLHDCEKPFRFANDAQFAHFPWIKNRPDKSDKIFQKLLVDHYGFVLSDTEWNALRYVEGEPESEYAEGTRLQTPLAAFCHICDTASARIWHEYPKDHR